MKKLKRIGFIFLAVGCITMLSACYLVEIETPLRQQKIYSEPVEILIHLNKNANPKTFQAWINMKNISDRFELTENGMKGLIGPDDGLRVLKNEEDESIAVYGSNYLMTKVNDNQNNTDFDFRLFFVKAGKVVTTRDDKGVWFINGPEDATYYDIFEAMGYAVATDRLWQAELFRRNSLGQLSELLGSSQLKADMFTRTIAYSKDELQTYFDALGPKPKDAIVGYAAGFNRRIEEIRNNPSLIPYEFIAVGLQMGLEYLQPNDWTTLDVLSWVVNLQRNFDHYSTDQTQIRNGALFNELEDKFGTETAKIMFDDLRWINDPDALIYIPDTKETQLTLAKAGARFLSLPPAPSPAVPDLRQAARDLSEMRDTIVKNLKHINAFVKMGSYAWVVSKDKTKENKPILYSGPQMGFSAPAIVVEGSIRAGGINISGMSVPGIPMILIGRTPHHAWSMQVGHANTVDFYLETPDQVTFQRNETIKVNGEDDIVVPVYRTSHGPVIYPMPYDPDTYDPETDGPIISWKYAHWGYEVDSANGFLGLALSESMDEFGEGIENMAVSQHFCYADRDGNIAYWMSGRDPRRPEGEWRFPQGFSGAPLEWDTKVLIPRSTDRNTTQQFYCGWNNKTNPDYLSSYGPFHRAQVIHNYLATHDNLTFEEVRDLALNIATTDSFGSGGNPWEFVENYFKTAVESNWNEERQAALDILEKWDGHFVLGGLSEWAFGKHRADGWVLMNAWIREVVRLTFDDELGTVPQSTFLLFNALLHGLAGENSGVVNQYDWFTNKVNNNAPQNADDIIISALDSVLNNLGEQPWGTDMRGETNYNHYLFSTPPLDLNPIHTMPFSSRSTYAHCVQYGESGPERIETMFPLGQSGNILLGPALSPDFDPNFYSMTDIFDGFEYRSFPLFD